MARVARQAFLGVFFLNSRKLNCKISIYHLLKWVQKCVCVCKIRKPSKVLLSQPAGCLFSFQPQTLKLDPHDLVADTLLWRWKPG